MNYFTAGLESDQNKNRPELEIHLAASLSKQTAIKLNKRRMKLYTERERERITTVQACPGLKNFSSRFFALRALSRLADRLDSYDTPK